MATIIGYVSEADGNFIARATDGTMRDLTTGMPIYEGESVVGDDTNTRASSLIVSMHGDFNILIEGNDEQLFDQMLLPQEMDDSETIIEPESIAQMLQEYGDIDEIDTAAGEEDIPVESDVSVGEFAQANENLIDISAGLRQNESHTSTVVRNFNTDEEQEKNDFTNQDRLSTLSTATNTTNHDISNVNINYTPTAVEDSATLSENGSIAINLVANDLDGNAEDHAGTFILKEVSISSISDTSVNDAIHLEDIAVSIVENQLHFNTHDAFDFLNSGENATVVLNYTMEDTRGATSTSSVTINIVGSNDAPILHLANEESDFNSHYDNTQDSVAITSSEVIISDVDDANMQEAHVTLSNAKEGDILSIVGDLPEGIHANISSDNGTIVVTLSGEASRADYADALEQIHFSNTTTNPDVQTRVFEISVNDGGLESNVTTATLTFSDSIAADAPTIDNLLTDSGRDANDLITNDATSSISGHGQAGETLHLYDEDNNLIGETLIDDNGQWELSTTLLQDGMHQLHAISTDAHGNSSDSSQTFSYEVDTQNSITLEPLVSSEGSDEAILTGNSDPYSNMTLIITDENGISRSLDTQADTNGDFSVTFNVDGLKEGTITLNASATDIAGNTVTQEVSDTLDNFVNTMVLNPLISDEPNDEATASGTTEPFADVNVTLHDANGVETTLHTIADENGDFSVTFDTDGFADGAVTLSAISTDSATNENSASINETLNTFQDSLTIDALVSDEVYDSASVTGNTEPDASVTLTLTDSEGTSREVTVTADANGDYTARFDTQGLSDGNYTVNATSIDGINGNIETQEITGNNLNTFQDSLTIEPLISDEANDTATVSGNTEPDASVTLTLTDSEGVQREVTVTADANGDYTATFDTNGLSDGAYTVDAIATDGVTGNLVTQEISGTNLNTFSDSLSISPLISNEEADTATLTGNTEPHATITLTLSDANGVENTQSVTADANGNYSATFNTDGMQDGNYTVDATATDSSNNSISNSTSGDNLNTFADILSINTLTSNEDNDTATVTGNTEPGATLTLILTDANGVENTQNVTADTNGDYSATFDTDTMLDGTYTISASATDYHGNTTTTQSSGNNLNTFADTLTSDLATQSDSSGAAGSNTDNITNDNTPTITGATEAGATVTITLAGIVIGTGVADANGNYEIQTDTLSDGEHTLQISAQDSVGNTTNTSETLTIDTATTNSITTGNEDNTLDDAKEFINFDTATNATVNGTVEAQSEINALSISDGNNTINVTPEDITINVDGSFSVSGIDVSSLADGDLTLSVTSTDIAGNSATSTNIIEKDTQVQTHADSNTTIEDTTLTATGNLLSNDEDTTSVTEGTFEGTYGSVTIAADGSYTYTLNNDATNVQSLAKDVEVSDSFTYTVTDEAGNTQTESLVIDVTGINDAVHANSDTAQSTQEDTALTITTESLLANDTDVDNDTLTITSVQDALHGDVRFNTEGNIIFTPDANYAGEATFTYTVSDGQGSTDTTTVTLNVTEDSLSLAPTADLATSSDSFGVGTSGTSSDDLTKDTTPTITGTTENGADVVITLADGTIVGSGVADANGNYAITTSNLNDGSQTLTITATDAMNNTASTTQTITIDTTTTAVNESDNVKDNHIETASGNVLLNDENDTVVTTPGTQTGAYGDISINADGSYTYTLNGDASNVMSLVEGEHVEDTFSYTLIDKAGNSDTATITINVEGTNDASVIINDTNTITELNNDDSSNLVSGNILANDSDVDDGANFSVTNTGLIEGNYGTLTLNADGSYEYHLNNTNTEVQSLHDGENLSENFTITTIENQSGDTGSENLVITIQGTNDTPIATNDDGFETTEDNSFIIDVLGNDTDIENDTLHITTLSDVTDANGINLGTVQIIQVDGVDQVQFTPDSNLNSMYEGELKEAHFSYEISDGNGGEDSATVSFSIIGTDDIPQVISGFSINEDGTQNFAITDSDGDIIVTDISANHGTLTYDETSQTFTYTPDANYSGSDTLSYTITDEDGDVHNMQTIANINPIVESDYNSILVDASGNEDTYISLDISGTPANSSDGDGSETVGNTITISGIPDGAQLLNLNGTLTITNGSITLQEGELDSLAIKPPLNSNNNFDLTVSYEVVDSATMQDGTVVNDSVTQTETLSVNVKGVADTTETTLQDTVAPVIEDTTLNASDDSYEDFDSVETAETYLTGTLGDAQGTDTYTFHHNGGPLTINALTEKGSDWNNNNQDAIYHDLDGSGTQTELDIMLDLRDSSGHLIQHNDDYTLGDTTGAADGSLHRYDSYIHEANLPAGDYSIDVTSWGGNTTGPYKLTLTGSIEMEDNPYEGDQNSELVIDNTLLLSNDSDSDGTFSITSVEDAQHGSVSLNSQGDIVFTPNQGYAGEAAFNYTLTDNDGNTNTAQVLLNITGSNTSGEDTSINPLVETPNTPTNGEPLNVAEITEDSYTLLSDLIGDVNFPDSDGSESHTIQISFSDAQFESTPKILEDGAYRNFTHANGQYSVEINADNFDSAKLRMPTNYSGEATATLTLITIENDVAHLSNGEVDTSDIGYNEQSYTLQLNTHAQAGDFTMSSDGTSGLEDTPIALFDNDAGVSQPDNDEIINTISIKDIPDGATILDHNGDAISFTNSEAQIDIDMGDGSGYTLAQFNAFSIIAPDNSSEDFTLKLRANTTDNDPITGNDVSADSTWRSLNVSVSGVADDIDVEGEDISGLSEDMSAFTTLDLSGELHDTDGSESLSFILSGLPEDTQININGTITTIGTDGSIAINSDDINSVSFKAPANFSGVITATLTATTTENDGDTLSRSDTFTIDIEAVADTATLQTQNAQGNEDSAIALNISSVLSDTDGSEAITIKLEGIPDGAVLTRADGSNITVFSGIAIVNSEDLSGLSITPPQDSNVDFELSVTAISTEATNSDEAFSDAQTIHVNVTGVADEALISASASGDEDTLIHLDLSAQSGDSDSSETLTYTLKGLPTDAQLQNTETGESIGHILNINSDGTTDWSLSADELAHVGITPPSNYSGEIAMTFSVASLEDDGDRVINEVDFTVEVHPVLDTNAQYDFINNTSSGSEDGWINLGLTTQGHDSESITGITIANLPDGAQSIGVYNGSTYDAISPDSDNNYHLSADQVNQGIGVLPNENSNDNFSLEITRTITDTPDDGSSIGEVSTTQSVSINVNVHGISDTLASLDVNDSTLETTGTTTPPPSTTPTHLEDIENISDNSTYIQGNLDQTTILGGADDNVHITGNMNRTIDLGAGDNTLEVDGNSQTIRAQGGDDTINIDGAQNAAIDLGEGNNRIDVDGNAASIYVGNDDDAIRIGGNANQGLDLREGDNMLDIAGNSSNIYSGSGDDTITVDGNTNGNIGTGSGDDTITIGGNSNRAIDANEGDDTVTIGGTANQAVYLGGGDDTLEIGNDVNNGISASSGNDTVTIHGHTNGVIDLGSGNDTLNAENYVQGRIYAAEGDDTVILGGPVKDYVMGGTGQDSIVLEHYSKADWDNNVDRVQTLVKEFENIKFSDGEVIGDSNAFNTPSEGLQSIDTIALSESVSNLTFSDSDGSESAYFIVSNANGADNTTWEIEGGINAGDGVWIVEDIDAVDVHLLDLSQEGPLTLSITPVVVENDGDIRFDTNNAHDFNINYIQASESSSEAETPPTLTIDTENSDTLVEGVEDRSSSLDSSIIANSDSLLSYRIEAPFLDSDGNEVAVHVEGAFALGDGTYVTNNLDAVSLNAPTDFSGTIDFNVNVISTADNGLSISQEVPMQLDLDPLTDGAYLHANPTDTNEDSTIALNLSLSSYDNDSSEHNVGDITLTPTNGGVLMGDNLVNNGDGSYSVSNEDLASVSFTPPPNQHGDFSVNMSYTTQDGDADTLTQTRTLSFNIASHVDSAEVSVPQNIEASEGDGTIAMTLSLTLEDSDGSESGFVEISGLPSELSLNSGSEYNGIWRVPQNDLDTLSIVAPEHFAGDFELAVTPIAYDIASAESAQGTTQTMSIHIDAVASDIEIYPLDTTSTEGDSDIGLNLGLSMEDTDGSEKVLFSFQGFPEGTTFSEGTLIGDTWVIHALTPQEAQNLTMTPPTHFSGDIELVVSARSIDGTNTLSDPVISTLNVAVESVISGVDHLSVTNELSDIEGLTLVDTGFTTSLHIDTALVDNSENLSLRFDGLGDVATFDISNLQGATLTQEGESWILDNLSQDNISTINDEGLTLVTQEEGTIGTIDITATATEDNGDTLSMTQQNTLDLSIGTQGSDNADTIIGVREGIDGGLGLDSLFLNEDENISMDSLKDGFVTNIETINLHDNAAHNISLSVEDVLDITDENNILTIEGDEDDTVEVDTQQWYKESEDDNTTTYTDSETDPTVSLVIDNNIDISEI